MTDKTTPISDPNEYPIRRGSRYDRAMVTATSIALSRAMTEQYNLPENFDDDNGAVKMVVPEVLVLIDSELFDKFSRLVVYTDKEKPHVIETVKGTAWKINSIAEHQFLHKAYLCWLETDESFTEAIDQRIMQLNAPLGPRHLLPRDLQTEAERTDPN